MKMNRIVIGMAISTQPAVNAMNKELAVVRIIRITAPILAPFVYGTLERLLLPFGLHYMLTIPMNYTSLGARGVIRKGTGIQVVYGPTVDVLKSDIIDLSVK
jgi:phosphotransferase system  glucose/maltose/N-acetylglucosamine-specific IIC component